MPPILKLGRIAMLRLAATVVVLLASLGGLALGQSGDSPPGLGRLGGFGGSRDEAPLTLHASFTAAEGKRPAQLSITAQIPSGWHIYSITQAEGGPNRTKIDLKPSDQFRLSGKFTPDPPPKVHFEKDAFGDLPLEEHSDEVTWTAPIEIRPGVDPARLEIQGTVNAQRCSASCLPPTDYSFTARLAAAEKLAASPVAPVTPPAAAKPPAAVEPRPATEHPAPAEHHAVAPPAAEEPAQVGQFRPEHSHAILHGWLEPAVAAPGSVVKLVIAAEPEAGYHVYPLANRDSAEPGEGKPTLIVLEQSPHWPTSHATADREPADCPLPMRLQGALRCYDSPIRWSIGLTVPPKAAAGEYRVTGVVGYQTCSQAQCEQPQGAKFEGKITIGPSMVAGNVPLEFRPEAYAAVASLANDAPAVMAPGSTKFKPVLKGTKVTSLGAAILYSLLGGLILNLMPCVLPVIGLKVLSFVDQGGQSRARVFTLNVWYSAGIVAIFMALATLAVYAGLAWGEHFQSAAFNITVSAVVFVMALSLLGVWEIPIPGFIGSGKAVELASREGAFGALAKGALTTVLATPCVGPFLGAVFSYTLTLKQQPEAIYLIYGAIGLGMASPYLLIGAFPSLIRFIPKPGAWMDTFKQLMGFVLLGTVVYLFTLLSDKYLVPTFALLIGLWAGCWWIGRTPLTADLGRKLRAWTAGGAFAAAAGLFAFNFLVPGPAVLPWQEYSPEKLEEFTGEGKTVMVDFTANWCPNCKVNLKLAIDTKGVLEVVKTNHVVPLVADWSNYSAEIRQELDILKSQSIPLLAIFPGDRPNEPIVLPGPLYQSDVIKALQEAGPSRQAAAEAGPRAAVLAGHGGRAD